MGNIQEQINKKNADILEAKAYLYETDYEVIKATERKYAIDESISQKRQEARDLINTRQSEIASLQSELDARSIEVINPIQY